MQSAVQRNPAGEAFAPSESAGEMFAVVDLDQGKVIAIGPPPLAMKKSGFHLCLKPIKRAQRHGFKPSTMHMPLMKYRDEPAHDRFHLKVTGVGGKNRCRMLATFTMSTSAG